MVVNNLLLNYHLFPPIYNFNIMKRGLALTKAAEWDLSDNKLTYMMNSLFLGTFKSNTLTNEPGHAHSFITKNVKNNSIIKTQSRNLSSQHRPSTSQKISSSLSKYSDTRELHLLSRTQKHSLRPKTSMRQPLKNNPNQSQDKMQATYTIASNNIDEPIQPLSNKVEKSMCSSKSLGVVKAYGVNSHKFYINPYSSSDARICIVSNLTKTTHKDQIISYFSLFEGGHSPSYLDFIRENLHIELAKVLSGYNPKPITEQLIENCFKKIQKKYCEFQNVPLRKKNLLSAEFDFSFGMVFVTKAGCSILTKGSVKVGISFGFGKQRQEIGSGKLKLTTIVSQSQPDTILIASEGIHAAKSVQSVLQLVWKCFLLNLTYFDSKVEKTSLHEMIGLVVDNIMDHFSTVPTSKNISMVLVAFESFEQIFNPPKDELQLPYNEGRHDHKKLSYSQH